MKRLLSFFLLLVSLGCEKEALVFEYRINDSLKTYVNTFYTEAENRGLKLQRENLIVDFVDSLEEDRCGQCERPAGNMEQQRRVLISLTSDCWSQEPQQNKEALVFHELGHCLLNREHKEVLFPSGAPQSIMTLILDGPYQPCEYVIGDNPSACNKTVRRQYYIDELFSENIDTIPSWAN
ncbi:putative metallopeptidase [uncultured Arcticibacterium sp.]|uniref:putative metallopeptidase n=1 Tax=uncultured Arcticibacterium sp. TaxID=2173042 RepID=UPI0030F5189F